MSLIWEDYVLIGITIAVIVYVIIYLYNNNKLTINGNWNVLNSPVNLVVFGDILILTPIINGVIVHSQGSIVLTYNKSVKGYSMTGQGETLNIIYNSDKDTITISGASSINMTCTRIKNLTPVTPSG